MHVRPISKQAARLVAVVFVFAAMAGGGSLAQAKSRPSAKDSALDASLREAVHSIPVADTGANIVVTSFRPRGDGPFPWVVLSHGTAVTREANLALGRNRNLPITSEWVNRGYAVFVPIRRGYGASGNAEGKLADSYGSCKRPNFAKAGEAAALDLLTTVKWAKAQRDLDPKRWMLVGQSSGGFASIYTASKRPEGLMAVLAFSSGRGGNPDTRPSEPCASAELAQLFSDIAPKLNVPVLWFYAKNDEYIGPRVQKLWFDSFRNAGGKGELFVAPPFPERRGHGVFPSQKGIPIWTREVGKFFQSQKVAMPF